MPQSPGMPLKLAIGDGARRHPGSEDGADRAPQLLGDILRERLAGLLLDTSLVAGDDAVPILGGEIGVGGIAALVLELAEDVLEAVMFDAEHDIGIHLDEAAIAVIGEARDRRSALPGLRRLSSLRPRLSTVSIMPGIDTRAPERTETSKRPLGIAELRADGLAHFGQGGVDLGLQGSSDICRRRGSSRCRPRW